MYCLISRELVNKWKCVAEPGAKFLEIVQCLHWKENTPGQIFLEWERNSDSAQSSSSKWGLSGWVLSKNSLRGTIIELPFMLEAVPLGSILNYKLHCSEPQR